MNFLNDATLQPRTMRVRAPRHDLSSTPTSVPVELALVPMTDAASAEAEDDFSRCGWFDSSLELAAGLQVIEHEDSLPDGLPLQPMHLTAAWPEASAHRAGVQFVGRSAR